MKQIEHDVFTAMSAGCETSSRITEYIFNEEALSVTNIDRTSLSDWKRYNSYQAHLRQVVHALRGLEKRGLVYRADDRGITVWRLVR